MFHLRSCKICFLKKKNQTCFSSSTGWFSNLFTRCTSGPFSSHGELWGGGDQTGLDFLVVYEPCPTD